MTKKVLDANSPRELLACLCMAGALKAYLVLLLLLPAAPGSGAMTLTRLVLVQVDLLFHLLPSRGPMQGIAYLIWPREGSG